MDSIRDTSFIPKKPLADTPPAYQKRSVSILTLAAVVVFVITLALSVGVFLYKGLLASGIESKKADLERARGAFDPALIRELERLDKRLTISKQLLDEHIALSLLFDSLERNTSRNVRYNSFDYSGSDGKKLTLMMRGEAKSYASVAFQSDAFVKTNIIRQPAFSDLTLDQRGNVVFTLSALVDSAALRYSNTFAPAKSPATTQATTSQPRSGSTTTGTPLR